MSWEKVFASLLSLTSSFLVKQLNSYKWFSFLLLSRLTNGDVARQVKNYVPWQEAFVVVYLMPPTPYPDPFDCIYKPSRFIPFFLFKHEGGRDEIIPMAINFFRFFAHSSSWLKIYFLRVWLYHFVPKWVISSGLWSLAWLVLAKSSSPLEHTFQEDNTSTNEPCQRMTTSFSESSKPRCSLLQWDSFSWWVHVSFLLKS